MLRRLLRARGWLMAFALVTCLVLSACSEGLGGLPSDASANAVTTATEVPSTVAFEDRCPDEIADWEAVGTGDTVNAERVQQADLRCSNLKGANLAGIDLSGKNLYQANLSGANLWGADLTGAHLVGATITGTSFARARLDGADFDGASFYGPAPGFAGAEFGDGTALQTLSWRLAVTAPLQAAGPPAISADLLEVVDLCADGYRDLRGRDLSGADLRGEDLTCTNLARADLSGANLSGVRAVRAFFPYANVRGADFSGADLRFASFYGAESAGGSQSANFNGADLRGATFAYGPGGSASTARMDEAVFTGSNFGGAANVSAVGSTGFSVSWGCSSCDFRWSSVYISPFGNDPAIVSSSFDDSFILGGFAGGNGIDVSETTFTNALFYSGWIYDSTVTDCDFTGAMFTGEGRSTPTKQYQLEIERSRIERSVFDGVDLREVFIFRSTIVDSSFVGGSMHPGIIQNSEITGSDFNGFSFLDTWIQDSDLRGSDLTRAEAGIGWSDTWCPDGTLSNDNLGTCEGHLGPG